MLKYQLKRSIVYRIKNVWYNIPSWVKSLSVILSLCAMVVSGIIADVIENNKQQSVLLIEKGRVNWVDFVSGYIGINGLTLGVVGLGKGITPDTKAMLRNVFPGDSVWFIRRNTFKVKIYEFRITKGL